MRVGIVGAGIGGLAGAAAFTRTGADVVVFERARVAPTGAGISLFGNGLRALDAIGVGAAVRAMGTPPELPAGIRTPSGGWLTRTPPSTTADLRVVHRGDLHAILTAAAPAVRIGTVAEVRTTADGATVVLESGQHHDFDIVVGADGIGSRIRTALFDDPGIRYAGYTAWRGVTTEPVRVTEAGEAWGRGERFGIAPMAGGQVYWFGVATVPPGWSVPDEGAEVVRRFASWPAPIGELLRATDARTILRNDILELARPLATFVRDRVALIGDAAHAMTPNLGQGGNQALEDAVTLAAFVGDGTDLAAGLARYDSVRRARTAPIARRSRQLGRIAQAGGPVAATLRDALIRMAPARGAVRAAERIQAWQPPEALSVRQ
jgi:2-polyprenyl-6-methoxyphenol hydroxylase-like FAD-dependent oxidoreductase